MPITDPDPYYDETASSFQNPRILLVVAAALIDIDNRVLLTQRLQSKPMAGLWEFPGGKVRPNETPEGALIRELYEELDINVEINGLTPLTFASHRYKDSHLLMPLFISRVWEGAPKSKEGQVLKWIRHQDFACCPMPPANTPLISVLCNWLQ